jgi:hypothetical protein
MVPHASSSSWIIMMIVIVGSLADSEQLDEVPMT